ISTLSSTLAGTYQLTITATSGTLTHTTNVTLVVTTTSDFSIVVSPSSQTLSRGSSTSYTVTIGSISGFSGTVSLGDSGLPSKANGTFRPSSIVGSGTSTLKITANKVAPRGTYTLTITGSSGSLSHSANVTLTIQ